MIEPYRVNKESIYFASIGVQLISISKYYSSMDIFILIFY